MMILHHIWMFFRSVGGNLLEGSGQLVHLGLQFLQGEGEGELEGEGGGEGELEGEGGEGEAFLTVMRFLVEPKVSSTSMV